MIFDKISSTVGKMKNTQVKKFQNSSIHTNNDVSKKF
jgi:hypothetical protein